MKEVLMVVGHPNFNRSKANKYIVDRLKEKINLNIIFLDDMQWDIGYHQKLLEKADLIILQFPLYWYTVPAIMHLWIESVMTNGFAYGTCFKLANKKILLSITVGGRLEEYQKYASHQDSLINLLSHLKVTFEYLKLDVLNYLITYDLSYLDELNYYKELDNHLGEIYKLVKKS